MSFLLRQKRSNGRSRSKFRPPSFNHNNDNLGIGGTPRIRGESSTKPAKVGGGQQLLLHRPQSTHPQQQQQQQQQQEINTAVGGVISMEEVMEDLRILEQQQRESQRKLASAKLTKQSRLQQRQSLQANLSCLKYSNGEQRAQLASYRDNLSHCTLSLQNMKLDVSRSHDAIKGVEAQLKEAYAQYDEIINLQGVLKGNYLLAKEREAAVDRSLTKAQHIVEKAQEVWEAKKKDEEHLRDKIAQSQATAKHYSEKTLEVRNKIITLEQELQSAQQMEFSTRKRAGDLAKEVNQEKQRHEDRKAFLMKRIEEVRAKRKTADERRKATEEMLRTRLNEQIEVWNVIVQIQSDEGMEQSKQPTLEDPTITFDITSVADAVKAAEVEEAAAKSDLSKQEAQVDQQQSTLANLREEIVTVKAEIESTRKSSMELQAAENKRYEANKAFLEELEQDRKDVQLLRTTVATFEESLKETTESLQKQIADEETKLAKAKEELFTAETENDELDLAIEAEKKGWEQDKAKHKERLEESRAKYNVASEKLEAAKKRAEETIQDGGIEDDAQEVLELERSQKILAENTEVKIKQILREYPELRSIDLNQVGSDNDVDVLADLREDCNRRIKAAQRKKKELSAKAELKKKQLQKEAAKKRKERQHKERRRRDQEAHKVADKPKTKIAQVAPATHQRKKAGDPATCGSKFEVLSESANPSEDFSDHDSIVGCFTQRKDPDTERIMATVVPPSALKRRQSQSRVHFEDERAKSDEDSSDREDSDDEIVGSDATYHPTLPRSTVTNRKSAKNSGGRVRTTYGSSADKKRQRKKAMMRSKLLSSKDEVDDIPVVESFIANTESEQTPDPKPSKEKSSPIKSSGSVGLKKRSSTRSKRTGSSRSSTTSSSGPSGAAEHKSSSPASSKIRSGFSRRDKAGSESSALVGSTRANGRSSSSVRQEVKKSHLEDPKKTSSSSKTAGSSDGLSFEREKPTNSPPQRSSESSSARGLKSRGRDLLKSRSQSARFTNTSSGRSVSSETKNKTKRSLSSSRSVSSVGSRRRRSEDFGKSKRRRRSTSDVTSVISTGSRSKTSVQKSISALGQDFNFSLGGQ